MIVVAIFIGNQQQQHTKYLQKVRGYLASWRGSYLFLTTGGEMALLSRESQQWEWFRQCSRENSCQTDDVHINKSISMTQAWYMFICYHV